MSVTREKTLSLFWPKVNKTEGCWLWEAGLYWDGYGKFWAGSIKKLVRAHRFSYELHHGEIGEGLFVCHTCDVPSCVNPDHLWLGTVKDNNRDMTKKGHNFFSTNNPSLKLSDTQVREIRLERGKGALLRELSAKYGVRESQICRIAKGARRGNVL